jgi:hypothetical protein
MVSLEGEGPAFSPQKDCNVCSTYSFTGQVRWGLEKDPLKFSLHTQDQKGYKACSQAIFSSSSFYWLFGGGGFSLFEHPPAFKEW